MMMNLPWEYWIIANWFPSGNSLSLADNAGKLGGETNQKISLLIKGGFRGIL